MNLLKSGLIASLTLGVTISYGIFSPVEASSCNLRTGLYQHDDGTKIYLWSVEDGGYQIESKQHKYTVNGQCEGNRFMGFGGHDGNFNTIILEKRGSEYYYYNKENPSGGAYYKKM